MLSMQKFSSNVIEKCMDRASEEIIVKYVHELADPAAMRPLLQASKMTVLWLAQCCVALLLRSSIYLRFCSEFLQYERFPTDRRSMLTPCVNVSALLFIRREVFFSVP